MFQKHNQQTSLLTLSQLLKVKFRESYHLWGNPIIESEGFGFHIDGIPVKFSVILNIHPNSTQLNIQVENHEAVSLLGIWDSYMYNADLRIEDVLNFIEIYRESNDKWPL